RGREEGQGHRLPRGGELEAGASEPPTALDCGQQEPRELREAVAGVCQAQKADGSPRREPEPGRLREEPGSARHRGRERLGDVTEAHARYFSNSFFISPSGSAGAVWFSCPRMVTPAHTALSTASSTTSTVASYSSSSSASSAICTLMVLRVRSRGT